MGIIELEGLNAVEDNAEERTCVLGSKADFAVRIARMMMNAISKSVWEFQNGENLRHHEKCPTCKPSRNDSVSRQNNTIRSQWIRDIRSVNNQNNPSGKSKNDINSDQRSTNSKDGLSPST